MVQNCIAILVSGVFAVACQRGPTGNGGDEGYLGTGSFTISGPSSFSGPRELNGIQEPGPPGDPDLTQAIGLSFETDRAIIEDVVWIFVRLSSLSYTGPGSYGCGVELLEPGQTVSRLCNVLLIHFPQFDEVGAAWTFPPFDPANPSLQPCTLEVRHDDDNEFDGALDCTDLVFWADSTLYAKEHPDKDAPLDLSGTWRFPVRQIFRRVD